MIFVSFFNEYRFRGVPGPNTFSEHILQSLSRISINLAPNFCSFL